MCDSALALVLQLVQFSCEVRACNALGNSDWSFWSEGGGPTVGRPAIGGAVVSFDSFVARLFGPESAADGGQAPVAVPRVTTVVTWGRLGDDLVRQE